MLFNGIKNVKIAQWFGVLSGFGFYLKMHLFERERDHDGGGAERGRENPQADSTLSSELNTELDPRTLRSWPKPKWRDRHLTDWATQAPLECFFLKPVFFSVLRQWIVNSMYLIKYISKVRAYYWMINAMCLLTYMQGWYNQLFNESQDCSRKFYKFQILRFFYGSY